MASQAFEAIVEDFEFLEDWEDRYRYVIEQGKAMAPLDEALKVPATKVDGCASQVWLHPMIKDGHFQFDGDSDALIVRGLIALLRMLMSGRDPGEVQAMDIGDIFTRLGLENQITANRRNGFYAMVERIRAMAAERAAG